MKPEDWKLDGVIELGVKPSVEVINGFEMTTGIFNQTFGLVDGSRI